MSNPFSEIELTSFFWQISRAIHEMHSNDIMHWDIKPENFFLTKKKIIKLGDFGESKILDKGIVTGKHTGWVGTEMYMSPEMVTFKGRGGIPYSNKTDVWGVGMVYAELMCLEYAFNVENQLERINAIAKGKNFRTLPDNYPVKLWELVTKMLSIDPHSRPNSREIVETIEAHIFEKNWSMK